MISHFFLLISPLHLNALHMRVILISLVLATALFGCSDPEVRLQKKAARIHEAVLTVDSHTDTPMNLMSGTFDFSKRNDPIETRSKIDLPRMKEGGMDGIWFAVFIGQRQRTPEGHARAKREAIEICDTIDAMVARLSEELEIATEAGDLKRITRKGKHAIYLGLENGYPIGNDLEMLDTFYDRGIRYVTIVHTGNNDICDSSNDTTEHGGLSPFGKEVVAKMNDLGMIVDLAHVNHQGFMQAARLSKKPVIVSHTGIYECCKNERR